MIETMFSSLTAMLTSPHMMGLMLLAVAIGKACVLISQLLSQHARCAR
jgi:hypothetical protein